MRYSILAHTTIQLMLNLSATSAGRLRISSQIRHLKEEECPILFDTTCSNSTSKIPVCGAFMGNGQMWNAHLPATARIIEAMGPIGGIVGSSSAAMTVFFLESIYKNRDVRHCGNRCCTLGEQTVRISFLLKAHESVLEFLELLSILQNVADMIGEDFNKLVSSLQGETSFPSALFDLGVTLFRQGSSFTRFVNPDFVRIILDDLWTSKTNLIYRTLEVVAALGLNLISVGGLLQFRDFVRILPIDLLGVVDVVDEGASFAAGYPPTDTTRFQEMLEWCATPELVSGNRWKTDTGIGAAQPFPNSNRTCDDHLKDLYLDYIRHRDGSHPKRKAEYIGEALPSLSSTSILEGTSYSIWKELRDEYIQNPTNFTIPTSLNFDELRIGYWGDASTLDTVEEQLPKIYPNDNKSQRFLRLGTERWDRLLGFTISEPGFSGGNIVDADKKWVSLGGWGDSFPVQVMDALGCDQIIHVVRRGGPTGFVRGVVTAIGGSLGFTEEIDDALYGFSSTSSSSVDTALETQTGAMCIDWGGVPGLDWNALAEKGYEGPFLSDDQCLQSVGAIPYQGGELNEANYGCIPLMKEPRQNKRESFGWLGKVFDFLAFLVGEGKR